jgi:small-conductance mechanosensitive channel
MLIVRQTLEQVAEQLNEKWGVAGREPLVAMTAFGDNAVNFEIGVWTRDPWSHRLLSSELHEKVWWALKEKGVTIAFPQLDVHLDPEVVEALQAFSKRATQSSSEA